MIRVEIFKGWMLVDFRCFLTETLCSALKDAADMLGLHGGYRRKAVIIYSAIYNNAGFDDPMEAARELKEDGVTIVTISYTAADGVFPYQLSNLASPGYAFSSNDTDLWLRLPEAMAQSKYYFLNPNPSNFLLVNCYCFPESLQFIYTDPKTLVTKKFADCVFGFNGQVFPSIATTLCSQMNASLVSVASQVKLDFSRFNPVSELNFNSVVFQSPTMSYPIM